MSSAWFTANRMAWIHGSKLDTCRQLAGFTNNVVGITSTENHVTYHSPDFLDVLVDIDHIIKMKVLILDVCRIPKPMALLTRQRM